MSQCCSTLLWQSGVKQQQVTVSSSAHLFSNQPTNQPTNNLGPEPSPYAPAWPAGKALLPGKSLILQCNLCSATGVTRHRGGPAVRNGAGMSSCLSSPDSEGAWPETALAPWCSSKPEPQPERVRTDLSSISWLKHMEVFLSLAHY